MTHKTRTNYLECACYLTLSSRTIASVRIAQEYRNQTTNNWHWCVLSDSLCLLKGGQESYSMMILNGMANTMSRLKGVDLGNPNIFPLINFCSDETIVTDDWLLVLLKAMMLKIENRQHHWTPTNCLLINIPCAFHLTWNLIHRVRYSIFYSNLWIASFKYRQATRLSNYLLHQ
jgi:hypothetical protein